MNPELVFIDFWVWWLVPCKYNHCVTILYIVHLFHYLSAILFENWVYTVQYAGFQRVTGKEKCAFSLMFHVCTDISYRGLAVSLCSCLSLNLMT